MTTLNTAPAVEPIRIPRSNLPVQAASWLASGHTLLPVSAGADGLCAGLEPEIEAQTATGRRPHCCVELAAERLAGMPAPGVVIVWLDYGRSLYDCPKRNRQLLDLLLDIRERVEDIRRRGEKEPEPTCLLCLVE